MANGFSNNMKRGLQPLSARQPQRAEVAEEYRDKLMTDVETYIAALREVDRAAAVECEQQAKLLRLQTRAQWWLDRRAWSAATLLRRPI